MRMKRISQETVSKPQRNDSKHRLKPFWNIKKESGIN